MDAWPGYFDEEPATSSKEKRKRKDKRVESPWRYPVVEHGSLAAATLNRQKKRYEWSFVTQEQPAYRLVASNSPIEVFPPTRPSLSHGPKVTPLQRVKQGAHFLRTFYPDVDIPTELMRNEIAAYHRFADSLKDGDTCSGNMLEVASFQSPRKKIAYLVFPMGDTNRQLNMSPLMTESSGLELKPTAASVCTFDTPIRQIVASSNTADIAKGMPGPMLGVRTVGSAVFVQVKIAFSRPTNPVEVVPAITIQRSDIGDRHALDISVSPVDNATGFVANDLGDVFRCCLSEGRSTVERVHCANHSTPVLCRIAACGTRDKILSIVENTAISLDLRTWRQGHVLHTVSQTGPKLTSIENPSDDHTTRLVSTDEVLWLDERNTRRPLLAVKHGRDFDITLQTRTYVAMSNHVTFLTSRRNSLVTVYDVARGSDNLIYMDGPPYALPPIIRPDGPHLGYAIFQHKDINILQLSERGGISSMNLSRTPSLAVSSSPTSILSPLEWPSDVKELEQQNDAIRSADLGPLAQRSHGIVDLQPAFERIFVQRQEESVSAQSNVAFDTLERMPMFWQDIDAPVEHVLTNYDIAMRSGPQPSEASRNDWFTGCSLDCAAGYRALGQGYIPRDQLTRPVPWHLDITPLIHRHVPEFNDDPQKTIDNLMRYELADGPERTADSFRRESEARSQLALDLSLASDVFSPHRPGKDAPASFDDDMLSISLSTQAMTLGDLDPPPVQFGFLRPVRKITQIGDAGEEIGRQGDASSQSIMPQGVRLLLEEWEVGTEPDQYTYYDPYDDSPTPKIPHPAPRRSAKEPPLEEPRAPAQRPPMVVSAVPQGPEVPPIAASHPAPTRKPLVAARSHDDLRRPPNVSSQPTDTWGVPPSSQEVVASTQVIPGPHGGRANAGKKKPAKKRLGGF